MRNYSRHNGKKQNGAIQSGIVVKRDKWYTEVGFRTGFLSGQTDRVFSGQNSMPDSLFRTGPPTLHKKDGPSAFLKAEVGSRRKQKMEAEGPKYKVGW